MILRSIALALLLAAGLPCAVGAGGGAAAPATAAQDPTDRWEPPDRSDPHDLGRGLRYARLGDLALAEPAAAARAAPALILDLRHASFDTAAEAHLRALLAQRSVARPLFILLGADTPAALRAAVPAATPGVLTLASAQAGLTVSLAVSTDPTRDAAARAALDAGRPLRELIEEKLDKPRFDEARLVRHHANGRRVSDDGGDAAPPTVESQARSDPEPAAQPELPLQDLVLQRAVFLHRALLALGHLPQKE